MKKLWLTFILVTCFLAGCSYTPELNISSSEYHDGAYTVNVESPDGKSVGSVMMLNGTKALCSKSSGTTITFYMYDFQTGKEEKLKTVAEWSIMGRPRVLIGDTAYFYITVADGLGSKNVLYTVDFQKNKMYQVSENTYSMKIAPMINLNGNLYVLQGDIDPSDGLTKTFLERIEPNGKTTRFDFKRSEDKEARTVITIDTDGEYIYAYEAGGGSYFTIYDLDFNCVFELRINDVLEKYPLGGGVACFWAREDYFLLTDFAATSMLCRYDENGAEVILYSENTERAVNFGESEHEFIFMRRTDDIYRFTPKTGELEKITYEFDNENTDIKYMNANNDNLFISKRSYENGDRSETWYYFPYED